MDFSLEFTAVFKDYGHDGGTRLQLNRDASPSHSLGFRLTNMHKLKNIKMWKLNALCH